MKFSIRDYLYPFEIFSLYRSLRKSAFLPHAELIALQNKKLNKLINHAYNNVPYYRELFNKEKLKPGDIKTIKDLVYIPVLTKDILRERFDDLTAINSKQFKPYLNRTSGSTGTPLQFLQDKNVSIARFAFFWHIWHIAGYKPYMRWAQVDGMFVGDKERMWHYNFSLNSLQISAYKLSQKNCLSIIKKLNEFNPRIIRGYPSALEILAANILEQKLNISFNLQSIITYSEKLHDHQRNLLENVFNCKVYDIYSMWEAVCLISECDHSSKHQHMEFSAMELLDENNKIVKAGIIGEITATSFYNYSMPLIRYKTGDLATLSTKICSCGRNYLVVKDIEGRKRDLLYSTKGDLIPFQGFLMGKFSKYDGLRGLIQTQIVQDKLKEVQVYLVLKNHNLQELIKSEISNSIKKRLGDDLKIDFILTDSIKKEKNGKASFVINNLLRSNPKEHSN
jgi:phenylacetate-CoA ligase